MNDNKWEKVQAKREKFYLPWKSSRQFFNCLKTFEKDSPKTHEKLAENLLIKQFLRTAGKEKFSSDVDQTKVKTVTIPIERFSSSTSGSRKRVFHFRKRNKVCACLPVSSSSISIAKKGFERKGKVFRCFLRKKIPFLSVSKLNLRAVKRTRVE